MRALRIPSKAILLGEYAVLEGGRALVAAIPPFFRLVPTEGSAPGIAGIPKESPAGRYLASQEEPYGSWKFEDPYESRGGFGASSAQFLAALSAVEGIESAQAPARALKVYRGLHASEEKPPSGADVISQSSGGIIVFDSAESAVRRATWNASFLGTILVFSATANASRKTATHSHLAELRARDSRAKEWKALADRGIEAFEAGRLEEFGMTLTWFARALQLAGLECGESKEDREAFTAIPGVFGAKGCGARLSDAMVVVVDPTVPEARYAVEKMAIERGLEKMGDAFPDCPGITQERAR